MRFTADAVFMGAAPFSFVDDESGATIEGTSVTFMQWGDTDAVKLTAPKDVDIASLIPGDVYHLELGLTRPGQFVKARLVGIVPAKARLKDAAAS